jgi:hypothetical protein
MSCNIVRTKNKKQVQKHSPILPFTPELCNSVVLEVVTMNTERRHIGVLVTFIEFPQDRCH